MKQIFNYLPSRIFSYYHEANKILKGDMPLPRMFTFMPTCLCNHNCPGCDWASVNKTKYVMPSENWKQIFNELSNIKSIRFIEFCGQGESMMHPDIHEMIKKAIEYGWVIGVLTNGTRLKGELLEDLIKHCEYIRVTMEAGSRKVFKKVKNPMTEEDGFDAVCRNIREAVKLKNKINPSCNISYKFAVGKENYKDMESAVRLAIDLGCDSIQFKAYRNTPSELDDTKKEAYDRKLQSMKELYKKNIIITGSLKPIKSVVKCFMTPVHVLVDAYGDVYNCCYFRHRMGSHKFGNIIRDGFEKVWFSDKHREVIKNVRKEECELYDCKFFKYNELMDSFMVKSRELDMI